MKISKLPLCVTALIVANSPFAYSAEKVLVREAFDTGDAGASVMGNSTTDGNAVWLSAGAGVGKTAVLVAPAEAKYGRDPQGRPRLTLAAAAQGVAYVTLGYDLDKVPQFRVKIGGLVLEGTDRDFQFMIGARKNSAAVAYGYVFQRTPSGYRILYKGAPDEKLVSVSDKDFGGLLSDVELMVDKNTQQLYLKGQPLDTQARPTQDSALNNQADRLDLVTIAQGTSGTFAAPKIQNLQIIVTE
ncbi:MAG: hypothetical protein ACFUZC_04290 [Chthoniobacteraceae bacterium]